ncbi:MAG: GIY-YIG nuclease family protein [Lentisphaeria bacterium]|nr:GIY-YIG nuclease family protein [Lentisphaeria bacterium]NQZ68207.1 GIY-YIG nuclease family protein [Lentisphaeria bacterium]
MSEQSDLELLNALGVEVKNKKKAKLTPKQERIIAGFEEIQRFVEEHGIPPRHGDDNDIFERLYATRLDRIRKLPECRELLAELDSQGLLDGSEAEQEEINFEEINDDELLAQLGVEAPKKNDITELKHVKTRAEKQAAEEIAVRNRCEDFESFKPLFNQVKDDLDNKLRSTLRFGKDTAIEIGHFFILGGQVVYVAEIGDEIKAPNGEKDARLRVIYSNGTESNILLRSLQRALYKDEAGRRLTTPDMGPLFSGELDEGDLASGTIYVLRTKLDHPLVNKNREVIHKIGVTGGEVKERISNAKSETTYLLSDVEVVATYKLFNINRKKLENLIQKFFDNAKLEIEIIDRFGKPVVPQEWFLVPLFVIDEAVEKIKDGTIDEYSYDTDSASLIRESGKSK